MFLMPSGSYGNICSINTTVFGSFYWTGKTFPSRRKAELDLWCTAIVTPPASAIVHL